jgi:hypothetical protein
LGVFDATGTRWVRVPLTNDSDEANADALLGPRSAIDRLLTRHELIHLLAAYTVTTSHDVMSTTERGRRAGSTNWSRERFWRRYREAAARLARPYRRTHLAAGVGLSYATFCRYLSIWGPPEGTPGPGD